MCDFVFYNSILSSLTAPTLPLPLGPNSQAQAQQELVSIQAHPVLEMQVGGIQKK